MILDSMEYEDFSRNTWMTAEEAMVDGQIKQLSKLAHLFVKEAALGARVSRSQYSLSRAENKRI